MSGAFKDAKLKSGEKVGLKLLDRGDFEALLDFYRRIPVEDRMYLRRDVTKREIIEEVIEETEEGFSTGIVAIAGGKIVGDSLLYVMPHGWFRKTGEVRVITDSEYRNVGLGTILAREIFIIAVKKGLRKLEACAMETQMDAQRMLGKLGFVREGVLQRFVVDLKGSVHDLVLLGLSL